MSDLFSWKRLVQNFPVLIVKLPVTFEIVAVAFSLGFLLALLIATARIKKIPLLDQIEGADTGSNYETTSECFMAVTNGVADLCIVDLPTAQSALLTNPDLLIITLAEGDTFTGDDEMVNVCIATRKDDTALRDSLQAAMDSVGWDDKAAMDELMARVIGQQPAAV